MLKQLAIGLVLAVASISSAAAVEPEWVVIRKDPSSAFSVDVNSVRRVGPIARGFYREDFAKTKKSLEGNIFVSKIFDMEVDCERGRFHKLAAAFVDASNRVVEEIPEERWQSVGKIIKLLEYEPARVICALADAETVPSIVKTGRWKALARNEAFTVLYDADSIESLDVDRVMITTRSDYRDYTVVDAVPGRYAINVFAVDCRDHASLLLASSFYLTPTVLIWTEEASKKGLQFERITRGSLFDAEFAAICTAPRIAKGGAPRKSPEEAGGLSVGTAWATNKGYLVTASHVVTGGGKIELYQEGKKIGDAVLVANDQANDVALLKYIPAGGAKLKMIPLADRPGVLGRPVFTLGFPAPDVMGQRVKMSKGDIAATSGIQDDSRFLQISMPIQQGNSGGPVVGFDGTAVGVVSAKLARLSDEDDSPRPENVNYAVKTSYLRPLLDELPDLADYVPIKAVGLSQEELVAQVSQAVYMVVVSD